MVNLVDNDKILTSLTLTVSKNDSLPFTIYIGNKHQVLTSFCRSHLLLKRLFKSPNQFKSVKQICFHGF